MLSKDVSILAAKVNFRLRLVRYEVISITLENIIKKVSKEVQRYVAKDGNLNKADLISD